MYKSEEERIFACFLDDLVASDYIISYEYEPSAIVLCDESVITITKNKKKKTKIVVENKQVKLLDSLIYTPDFKVVWNCAKSNIIFTYDDNTIICDKLPPFYVQDGISYIEVKPSYDRNNMTRYVKVKLAWIYDKYKTYTNLVIPQTLFKKTFYPDCFFYTKLGKERQTKQGSSLVSLLNISKYNKLQDYINATDMCN